jgi:hypothetical protein
VTRGINVSTAQLWRPVPTGSYLMGRKREGPRIFFYLNGVPVEVDWTNLEHVCRYADRLGPGQSVIAVPGRNNYNIVHTKREHEYKNAVVWYRTPPIPSI